MEPELCSNCLPALQSIEECMLYDENNLSELSPLTCPVCAIIDFDCSMNKENTTQIDCRLTTDRTGRRSLSLEFDCDNKYDHTRELAILPVNETLEPSQWSRDLPRETLTGESIAFLKEQFKTCEEEHPYCQRRVGTRPTRLLRIERPQGQDCCVYLNDDGESEVSAYATLSHCWGNVQPVRLTKATETELRAGLPIHRLPRSFYDAVLVCEQLWIRYLWIDSLCIFQDNLQDWAHEASAMRSVYTNAMFNIAATGASDCSVGLSFVRNHLAHRPFRVTTTSSAQHEWVFPPDWTGETILDSPLNRRAWVMQERFLSNRILHFTIEGVYWECLTTVASEVHQVSPPYQYTYDFKLTSWLKDHIEIWERSESALDPKSGVKLYDYWVQILAQYTKCGITKDKDKLVALNGIAQRLEEAIGVKFVCGMSEMFLISELLWEVESGRERWDPPPLLEWRAPSWSWAGGNYSLTDNQYRSYHLTCDKKQEMAEVTSKDVTALPSGQLVHVSLVLRARPVQAKVCMEDFVWWDDPVATVEYEHGKNHIDGNSLVFDSLPLFPYEEELTFIALMRCHCENDIGTAREIRLRGPEPSIAALMLRRLPTTPTTYSRVGVLRLRRYEPCEFYNENQPVDEEDIVVV